MFLQRTVCHILVKKSSGHGTSHRACPNVLQSQGAREGRPGPLTQRWDTPHLTPVCSYFWLIIEISRHLDRLRRARLWRECSRAIMDGVEIEETVQRSGCCITPSE